MPRKNKSTAPAAPRPLTGPQRLNKVLAAAGLGSRRDCEQYILDGRIEVDGEPVTDLATKVDLETAKITFDGTALKTFRPVYYALHKPSGVLSTNRDPSGRMRAIDLVNVKERVFSVGRLDRFSEGLMLLTNDGELAQRLAHPRFGVQKLYLATVQGEVTQTDLEKLVRGVRLSEGFAKVDGVKLRRQRSGAAELEIALSEGKNREIRRILARLGHKVVALRRLAIGPLRLGQLPVGGWRPLTREEVLALYSTTAHRRKRRGIARPVRASHPPQDAEEPLPVGTSVGHFHQSFEEEDDDDFGPSPLFDEAMADDDGEVIALSDESLLGTVIPYDEEAESEDAESDDFDQESNDRPRRGRPDRGARSAPRTGGARGGAGARSAGARGGASRSDGARPAAARSSVSSSPWDLRNRTPKTAASRSERPRTGGARTGGPRAGGTRTSGSRTSSTGASGSASAGPRSNGPRGNNSRSGGPRSAGGSTGSRTAAPRTGGARPAGPRSSGPRSTGPRSGAPRTGAPRSTGPRTASGGPASRPSGSRTTAGSRSAPRAAGPRSSAPRSGPRTGGASTAGPRSGGASRGGRSSAGGSSRGGGGPKGKRGGGGGSTPRGKRK